MPLAMPICATVSQPTRFQDGWSFKRRSEFQDRVSRWFHRAKSLFQMGICDVRILTFRSISCINFSVSRENRLGRFESDMLHQLRGISLVVEQRSPSRMGAPFG